MSVMDLILPSNRSVNPATSPTPVEITGTITDTSGRPATSGWIEFSLQPSSQSLAYSVLPDTVIATSTRGQITSGGQLVSDLGSMNPFVVWPNDLILPSNSLYQVIIAPNGRVARVYQGVLIQSKTNPQDLASLTFVLPQAQVVGTTVNGNPLITMSVIPAVDSVWTVGDPLHYYVAGYFHELYVDNLYAGNIPALPEGPVPYTYAIESSNMFGQPQPGQVILLHTCFVQTIFPPNFASPASYGNYLASATNDAVCTVNVAMPGAGNLQVGTITIKAHSAGGAVMFSTSGFTINPGELLYIYAPSPMDPTLSDIAISLVGTRTS